MNADFPRILTLLRKEKGVSQKEVAAKLGISQALLSHYEKGIRECGLDFLTTCWASAPNAAAAPLRLRIFPKPTPPARKINFPAAFCLC